MWDEFAKELAAANQSDSGNIYQNAAFTGINMTGSETAGSEASAQAAIDEQRRADAARIAQAEAAQKAQMAADAKDPRKAEMVMREDRSGYDFYDGTGKKLNINQYSLLTGMRPDQILADSDNPNDMRFVAEYNVMRDITNAYVNGDSRTLAKYKAQDPDKFDQLVSKYKTPQEMMEGFMSHYSDYYGNTQGANTGRSFAPQAKYGPADKEEADRLMGSSMDQIMTPTMAAPREANSLLENAGRYGPAAIFGGGWLWGENNNFTSPEADARKRWEEEQQNNPWASYRNSLFGG